MLVGMMRASLARAMGRSILAVIHQTFSAAPPYSPSHRMNVLQSGPHSKTRAPFFSTLRFEFDSVRCASPPAFAPAPGDAPVACCVAATGRVLVFPVAVKKGPAKTNRPQARCGTAPRTAMTLENEPAPYGKRKSSARRLTLICMYYKRKHRAAGGTCHTGVCHDSKH
jgi:hypothetical protein